MDWKNTFNQIADAAKQAVNAAADSGKSALERHRVTRDITEAKLALAELYLERYTAGEAFDEETAALCDDILDNMAKVEAMEYAAQDARIAAKDAAAAAVNTIKAEFTAEDAAECIDEECDAPCCPDCGYPMLDNFHFCPSCGVKLETVDDLVDIAEEVAAPAAEVETPAGEAVTEETVEEAPVEETSAE